MGNTSPSLRMPAEWEPHRATWIAWPHLESDFPGKLESVRWAYTEIVRHLSRNERVEILCATPELSAQVQSMLEGSGISGDYKIHIEPYHRSWLRDSAPTGVIKGQGQAWVQWQFNAWAKYQDFEADLGVPTAIAKYSGREILQAVRHDNQQPLVLEGGAIETDGQGTLLVTEQCLLSQVQERNSGFSRSDYEKAFKQYLGITNTIWLVGSCEGDDTHGHIDDVARFVAPGVVVVVAADPSDREEFEVSQANIERLRSAKDASGKKLEVVELPFPAPLYSKEDGELIRLPASYANFYLANGICLVPTFNDPKDRIVLGRLSELMPDRTVVGIHAVDYVLGFGTLHCSTQQEPA